MTKNQFSDNNIWHFPKGRHLINDSETGATGYTRSKKVFVELFGGRRKRLKGWSPRSTGPPTREKKRGLPHGSGVNRPGRLSNGVLQRPGVALLGNRFEPGHVRWATGVTGGEKSKLRAHTSQQSAKGTLAIRCPL